jgi:hypothetical protein
VLFIACPTDSDNNHDSRDGARTLTFSVSTGLLTGYTTDVTRWIKSMTTDEVCVNVMGYANETQTGAGETREEAPADFQYDKKQFFTSKSYDPGNRVYIIKHADGERYSKIQTSEYERNTSEKSDTYVIK